MEYQQNALALHFTNNSVANKPNKQQLDQAALFLTEALPGLIMFMSLIFCFIFKFVF
jgi:hypothetical protein